MKYFSVKVLFHPWNDLDIKDRKGGRGSGRGGGEGGEASENYQFLKVAR